MKTKPTLRFIASIFRGLSVTLIAAVPALAQFAATGTTTLSVTIAAESAISVTSSTTTLSETAGAGIFGSPFTGTTNFSYKVRSMKVGGGGSITVKITTDFAAGGPSVASPPVPADQVTYTCTTASSATPCTGSVNASTSTATNVATFATDAHSTVGGSDAGSVSWTVPNDPIYKTGTYSATATFTISAT
jgi:hypothetical protein